jgi:hypothetical protein
MEEPGVLNWPEAQSKQKVWPEAGVYCQWFEGQFMQLEIEVLPVWEL